MKHGRATRQQVERITTPPAAPLLITEGAEVTEDAVWVWLQIPAGSTYLLEDEDLTHATWETSASMATLLPAGAEYHIKVLWSQYSAGDYTDTWTAVESVRAPGAPDYIELGAQRITRNSEDGHYRRRIVLLGLRWPDTAVSPAADRAGRAARRQLRSTRGTARHAQARLAAVRTAVDRWIEQMQRSPLAATAAPAGLIAWAYAREMRRTAVSVPDEPALSGPKLVALMHGQVDPTQSTEYVVVTDAATGAVTYVSILVPSVNGFPVDELQIPGGEWLEILTELPGTEASVRGVNHGHAESLALIDTGRKLTRSQTREAGAHGAQTPVEVLTADDTLNERRLEVQRRLDVETTNHARWVVTAADPDALADKVAAVRQRYTGVVELQVVPYVQDLLWRELLPGDRVRVPEFGQDQPMRTLAGSWFHGGSAVGDDTGPYLGANLGSTPGPVQAHIVSRSDDDKTMPTTTSFTGRSGSGKSTAVEMVSLGALAEGAWELLVDPKGDLAGIVEVAARLLNIPVQVIDVVDAGSSGVMDPMRFCPTADEARTLTLDAMLGALSTDDRRHGEIHLEAAIDTVLRQPRQAWSAQAVLGALLTTPQGNAGWETARAIGNTLILRARQAHLRAVLGPLAADVPPLLTGRGLVYLSLAGLEMPRHNPDPEKWTVAERCSITTFRVSLSYALAQSRRVRQLKKLVALTELHLITGYPEGRAFIEWIARTGRALQVFQLLDSQSAADLSAVTSLHEQLVMSFAFQATGRVEQDAQAVLLGRPTPGPRLRQAQSMLSTGQCVMRDRYGRLSLVEIDRLTGWIAQALSTDAGEDSEQAAGGYTTESTMDGSDDNLSVDGTSGGPVADDHPAVAASAATGTETP